jgi:hypothetical protein
MDRVKSIAEWMAERGLTFAALLDAAALDRKVLQALIDGRYTPSPEQRRRVAAALSVEQQQIAWGHLAQVEHMYGHGPQFGRSP